MKKLLFTFWSFFTSIFLQMILLLFAFISWEEAGIIGREFHQTISQGEIYSKISSYESIGESASQNIDVAITSGFNGGALAMGLITCICVFGVVWLQINKQSKP